MALTAKKYMMDFIFMWYVSIHTQFPNLPYSVFKVATLMAHIPKLHDSFYLYFLDLDQSSSLFDIFVVLIFCRKQFLKSVSRDTTAGLVSSTKLCVFIKCSLLTFYPAALKGSRGIVVTHGVQLGGQAPGNFVWPVSQKP